MKIWTQTKDSLPLFDKDVLVTWVPKHDKNKREYGVTSLESIYTSADCVAPKWRDINDISVTPDAWKEIEAYEPV